MNLTDAYSNNTTEWPVALAINDSLPPRAFVKFKFDKEIASMFDQLMVAKWWVVYSLNFDPSLYKFLVEDEIHISDLMCLNSLTEKSFPRQFSFSKTPSGRKFFLADRCESMNLSSSFEDVVDRNKSETKEYCEGGVLCEVSACSALG